MIAGLLHRRYFLASSGAMLVAVPRVGDADSAAVAPIRQLVQGLLRVMKAGRGTPFSVRAEMLGPVIDQTFDLATILKTSVGFGWDTLSADQQASLSAAFRRYTVASYVNAFDQNDEHFEVNPDTRVSGSDQVVRMRIVHDSGEQDELDHVMRQGPKGWRVVDILADGVISRVAVQRSDFRQVLSRGGASALAQSLESKSTDLSTG
ncbi:ABC transporter substrate-binding protein [Rhodopila sp.]|uniref:ABC transporter substrate-binding protein n=1 Tax=Rhodopila sp. TaxID=2480087 RepID=UPI003D0B5CF6